MNTLLTKIILDARNYDVEGWMDILVLVIIAVVYGIGSIIKAKRQKLEGQPEGKLPRKPVRRPPAQSRGVQEQLQKRTARPVRPAQPQQYRSVVQQPRVKPAVTRTAAGVSTSQAEKNALLEEILPTLEPGLTPPKPQIHPDLQQLPEFTSKAVEELEGKRVPIPSTMSQMGYLSELLLDYADPEELRRAILHYEILGKPLSLRSPY